MSETPTQHAPRFLPWYHRAPVLTMALNLALIMTIFLTRERWEPWVEEYRLPVSSDWGGGVEASPDGRRALIRDEQRILVVDVESGKVLFEHKFQSGLMKVLLSSDGRHIAIIREYPSNDDDDPVAIRDAVPLIVDVETGKQKVFLKGHDGGVRCAVFSQSGALIATAGTDETARVWDVATGRQLAMLHSTGAYLCALGFSPDDARIVTNSGKLAVGVWDAATGKLLVELKGHDAIVNNAEFGAGGSRVITACHRDKTCRIWDARTGKQIVRIEGYRVACSPDRTRLVTTMLDSEFISIWDASTGNLVTKLKAGRGRWGSKAIRFSPDGRLVATQDSFAGTRVSEVETGKIVFGTTLFHPTGAAFTADGSRLVVSWNSGWDGSFSGGAVVSSHDGKLLTRIPDARFCTLLNDRRILVQNGDRDFFVLGRIRPEWWWGVFWLWHFWFIIALALAVAWSGWRDIKRSRAV